MPRQGLDTDRVVTAAEGLADEGGLEAVTFVRLAASLGVKPPSLYNHVKGRDALLRLITLRGLEGLDDAISAAAAGLAGADALRATAHAYRDYARAHPGRYEATLAAPGEPDPEVEAAAARLLGTIAAILRAWRLEGDEAIDVIRVVRSALHGFVALERAGGFAMARDINASFERLADILVAGLGQPLGVGA
jgi:AcrR family transcriptional regulator